MKVATMKRSICKIQGVNRHQNWACPYLIEEEFESGGTAFFVDPKLFGSSFPVENKSARYLLTNFHVVSHYTTRYAILEWPERNQSYITAEVLFVAPNLDVAILVIDTKLPQPKWQMGDHIDWLLSIKPLRVDIKNIHKGNSQAIRAIGFPHLCGDYQISDGLLSSRGMGMLSCDISLNSGNSGGPLFLKKTMAVIGICTAAISDSERIGLAVPLQQIGRFFQHWCTWDDTILRLPSWGMTLKNLSHDYMQYKKIEAAFTGGLVKEVIPGQAVDQAKIKEGDIIMGLESKDSRGEIVKFKVDMFSQVKFCSTDKRVQIDTVEFLLNLDPNYLKVHYHRKGKIFSVDVLPDIIEFKCRVRYPSYEEEIPYCLFGGMCFSDLHVNMLDASVDDEEEEEETGAFDHSVLHQLKTTKGMENIVICTHINPQSYPVFASDIAENEQIVKVNRTKIKDCNHLNTVLDKVCRNFYAGEGSDFCVFHTTNNSHVFSLFKLSIQEREDNEKMQLPVLLRLLKLKKQRKRKRG